MKKTGSRFFSIPQLAPFRIVVIYAVFSFIWIYFSDTFLGMMVSDPRLVLEISVFKGFTFVLVTALLLFFFIRRDIAKTIHNEEVARGSERKYRELHESLTDAFVSVDIDGRLQDWNQAYQNMLGYPVDELRRKTYQELTPPRWHAFEAGIIKDQVLPRGYSDIYEKTYRRQDGKEFPVELRTILIRDNKGEPTGMWAIVRDITGRKQMEQALRDSEARFRDIITHAPISMAIVSMDGTIEFINQKAIDVFGYLPEDIPTMERWWALAYPDEAYRREVSVDWMERVRQAVAGGEIRGNEYRVTCKDGSVKVMFISGSFVSNKVFVLFDDITLRKQAEEGLRKHFDLLEELVRIRTTELTQANERLEDSRNYFDRIFQALPDPVFVKDRQHRWVLLNDLFCRFMGRTHEELYGKSDADFFPKEQVAVFWAKDEEVFNTGVENLNEEFFTDGQGVVRTIMTKKILYTDKAGNKFIVGIIRDITDFRRASEQLVQFQARMEQSEKLASLGQLVAGIAHEINNPLAYVLSNLETMKKSGADHEVLSELPALIDESIGGAQRIARIVLDLRAFVHPEGGDWQEGDLNRALDSALNIVRVDSDGKITVVREYGDLPAVRLKEQQMTQVFINLLSNAVQAITGRGTVTVRTYARRGDVFAEVEDTGSGIKPENLSRIFDPFFTTKEVGQGTGLGLSIVQSIIDEHKGSVSVRDRKGGGTVFIVQLSAVKAT
ncbi:MAG: PAS domain S-box protein [Candidatus Omnitrophota bacterium]